MATDSDAYFGIKADAMISTIPTGFTVGGHAVTVADGAFSSADIGKLIYCSRGGTGYIAPILPLGTITAVASATQITSSTAWSEAHVAGIPYELIWGTDDTAGLLALGANARATGLCVFPPGRMILRRCPIDLTGVVDRGLAMRGAGKSETVLHISPEFDFSTTLASPFSCLLFKTPQPSQNISNPASISDFRIQGPLHGFAGKAGYHGLVNDWNEASFFRVYLEQLGGLAAGIRNNAKATFIDVRSKNHFYGDTAGFYSTAFFNAYYLHTGNCSGRGTHIINVNGATQTNQEPLSLVNCLFDECGANRAALFVQESRDVKIIASTAFGGPNQTSFGLELYGTSTVTMIGSTVTGYGTASPRNAVSVAAASSLKLTAGSLVAPGGTGTGIALANLGTVLIDGSSTLTGATSGAAPRRQAPGTALPAALPTNGSASNAQLATAINALRALAIATGAGS